MNKKGGVDLGKSKMVESPIQAPDLGKLAELGKQERQLQGGSLLSQEHQCYELLNTVKCRLAPSKVHGVGVIVTRDIQKGEPLYCALTVKPCWYHISFANLKKHVGQVRPEVLQLILDRWPLVVNGAAFLSPNYDQRLPSFINHSDNPNYDPKTDLALRDIKAGEEVLEDYRVVPNYELAFPWLKPMVQSKSKKK